MPETRRKDDPEFREWAVRIVRETGKPVAEVARDLGIHAGTLGEQGPPRPGRRETPPRWTLATCAGSSVRTPSCGWSVRSSSDPWSCESRRRRDERGVVRRRPEDRSRCATVISCRALEVSESWFYKWRHRPPIASPAAPEAPWGRPEHRGRWGLCLWRSCRLLGRYPECATVLSIPSGCSCCAFVETVVGCGLGILGAENGFQWPL